MSNTLKTIQLGQAQVSIFHIGDIYLPLAQYMNVSLYRNLFNRVVTFSVGLFSRDDPPNPLFDAMLGVEYTQFYFIAAGNNTEEVEFFEQTLLLSEDTE